MIVLLMPNRTHAYRGSGLWANMYPSTPEAHDHHRPPPTTPRTCIRRSASTKNQCPRPNLRPFRSAFFANFRVRTCRGSPDPARHRCNQNHQADRFRICEHFSQPILDSPAVLQKLQEELHRPDLEVANDYRELW